MLPGVDRGSSGALSGSGGTGAAPPGSSNLNRAQSIYDAASPAGARDNATPSQGNTAPSMPLPFYKFVNIPGAGSGAPPGAVPEESCAGKIVSGAVLG
jgi:hypothetical protein